MIAAQLRSFLTTGTWRFAAILVVVLAAVNIVALPSMVGPSGLSSSLAGLAPFALLGMASAPAILSGHGGIDLSVAPLMGLVNVVMVTVFLGTPFESPFISVPILLALGAAVGAINGIAVAVLRFPAVIATLCTYFVLTGITLALVPTPVTAPNSWVDALAGSIAGVPGALLTIAAPLVIWFVLRRTAYVDNLLLVGDNEIAAFTAGVRVVSVRVIAYALGGLFAAVAGIALTALVRTADAALSQPYVLIALAAVAIGGVKLSGGVGGLIGPLMGAGAIFLLSALLTTLRVPATWLSVAYGAALLLALLVNALASTLGKSRT